MSAGDRIRIKDQHHSWYGETGTLTMETMNGFPHMYRVELNNGIAAGCYLRQLEKL